MATAVLTTDLTLVHACETVTDGTTSCVLSGDTFVQEGGIKKEGTYVLDLEKWTVFTSIIGFYFLLRHREKIKNSTK